MSEATAATALNTFIDADQVKRDIAINPNDLDSAMIHHASLELHYALQTAHARRQYERIKTAVEITEANLDAKHRELFNADGKKVTEGAIKAAVSTDPAFKSVNAMVIDAQHVWKLCEATENAFRSRKDMLLEVARDRRKEKEGQLRVMEHQNNKDRAMAVLSGTGS